MGGMEVVSKSRRKAEVVDPPAQSTRGWRKLRRPHARWRTVDIVVASVLAVAGGLAFWGWDQLWYATSTGFAWFPPAQAMMYGLWLAPGVLAGLVIRKPGAALYTELVAAIIENLLGTSWGLSVIFYGLAQGAAPEIVFALFAYRFWRLPAAVLAGAASGCAAAGLDLVYYYPRWEASWKVSYVVIVAASAALIAGVGCAYLVKALARTGVLQPFASGRRAAGS
jgi:energy-coupling factor transport system substrate-specific component